MPCLAFIESSMDTSEPGWLFEPPAETQILDMQSRRGLQAGNRQPPSARAAGFGRQEQVYCTGREASPPIRVFSSVLIALSLK